MSIVSPSLSDPSADALCADCGLCCSGTLFASVRVDEEEAARLDARLPMIRGTEHPLISLPCAGLKGELCSVYPDRPQRCRTFLCELRRDVDDGRVSVTHARTLVNETRRLAASITRRLPPGMAWWTARARLSRDREALSPERQDLLSAIEELAQRLAARFWQ